MFWTRPGAAFDADLIAQWAKSDAPRLQEDAEVPGGGWQVRIPLPEANVQYGLIARHLAA